MSHFQFRLRIHISGSAEARVAKFCVQIEYIIASLGMTDYPYGHGQGYPFLRFCPNHVFAIGDARHFKFRVPIDTQEY